MEEKIQLKDLIELEKLQRIQDSFSKLAGIAAGICDEEGNPVTIPSGATDFCGKYTKATELGAERCRLCDKRGGELAQNYGKTSTYICHAGMVDCAAPIIVDGKMIGCFLGGQVRVGELDEDRIVKTARDIGVDPGEYLAAAYRTPKMPVDHLIHFMDFVYEVTNILSDTAYRQYELQRSKVEIEHAAQLKSDFLANMSHEIRTPMNGVIGMAELAMREEISPQAREYVSQICNSGKTLLTIINDILDFSKIESGMVEIVEEEYEPLSVMNDSVFILLSRIGEKAVELTLDVDMSMPGKLLGDSVRVKQVLLNLANNAIKYTDAGQVLIRMGYERVGEERIDLKVEVKDTGIGIKKEDIPSLFMSFQQVNSKRNRHVEGTGLGLAIAKNLIELMHGEIHVESEVGKGSTFSFRVPQKIIQDNDFAASEIAVGVRALGIIDSAFEREQLEKDIRRMGGECDFVPGFDELTDARLGGLTHLFVDTETPEGQLESIANLYDGLEVVVLTDAKDKREFSQENIVILRKPAYGLPLANLFGHKTEESDYGSDQGEKYAFIAPEARILIVDDNEVNLKVVLGLLQPLEMQMDTALSGKEAIRMIEEVKYDLIFMDHMMPDLDGVETTHVIRRFHSEYSDVPIIALTANVIAGTKEMFLREGMNDCVTKPIEVKSIVSKLRRWLPNEKQVHVSAAREEPPKRKGRLAIEGLDTEYALKLLGTEELYRSVLKDYHRLIGKKSAAIQEAFEKKDWKTYTIEVHALKSASRQIGAVVLAEGAAALEKAGREEDLQFLGANTGPVLQLYRSYEDILGPFLAEEEDEGPKEPATDEALEGFLRRLSEAMDDLDMDQMEAVLQEMSAHSYQGERQELVGQLRESVGEMDVEKCARIVEVLMGTLREEA